MVKDLGSYDMMKSPFSKDNISETSNPCSGFSLDSQVHSSSNCSSSSVESRNSVLNLLLSPFICTWQSCGWRFSRSDELSRHRRSHLMSNRTSAKCVRRSLPVQTMLIKFLCQSSKLVEG